MASKFKRTSVRRRHAAAKALASGKYRQRVVPNKKRKVKADGLVEYYDLDKVSGVTVKRY